MSEHISFDGQVQRKVFSSPDYYIYGMQVDLNKFPYVQRNKYGNVSIVGSNLYELEENLTYHVVADAINNDKFGTQYRVISISADAPKSGADVYKFLSTILTQKQADVLYHAYPNILDLIQQDRTNEIDVNTLNGIGEKTLTKTVNKIRQNFMLIDVCSMFYNLFEFNIIQKLYNIYGSADKIKDKLKREPYQTLTALNHVGFRTADLLLQKLQDNIEQEQQQGHNTPFVFMEDIKTSKDRCRSCMVYYLQENEQEGNTKMSMVDLQSKVRAYTPEAFYHFDDVVNNDDLQLFYYDIQDKTIALLSTYKCESYIAARLLSGLNNSIKWDIFQPGAYKQVDDFELSDDQELVQSAIDQNNIVILSGFAGSGKSSSVKALINMLIQHNKTFAMAAPSAKAAKVLCNYSGYNAKTIHRLLLWEQGGFIHNHKNPLVEDLIIIDEISMCDIYLFAALLDAIDFTHTKLLLIGDHCQLQSVGAGSVLRDLMQSHKFVTINLTKIFRYGSNGILTVATDTRQNKCFLPNVVQQPLTIGDSYMFIPCTSEMSLNYVTATYKKMIEHHTINECMVITPLNKGPYGTLELNNRLQHEINQSTQEIVTQIDNIDVHFKLGDIVLNIVNNYKSTVCDAQGEIIEQLDGSPTEVLIANGESGRIIKVLSNGLVIQYDDYTIFTPKQELSNLRLGYAISCHKSQGSGYKVVILLSVSQHAFFSNSSLMYTALTRAKHKIIQIGSAPMINRSVKTSAVDKRKTHLQNLLRPGVSIENNKETFYEPAQTASQIHNDFTQLQFT